jgi:hypothetical protein
MTIDIVVVTSIFPTVRGRLTPLTSKFAPLRVEKVCMNKKSERRRKFNEATYNE